MKIDNAPSVQSMLLGRSQKNTNSSTFSSQLKEQVDTSTNNITIQQTTPNIKGNISLPDVNIISREATPFLSKEEVDFFEKMMQKNINPQGGYKTYSTQQSSINIKT
ncbi:hypothetical protein BW722_00345 [Lawsonia intracellularis]|uniref:hypothetical protein n=1 Tax=Lawsonia intracellularis TaxID=29546 RepID=UPI0009770A6C|nr:hypothetical protein [Lawsonia intracellularis]OMQ06122.1 hypothetical protein BW722_00345 [Lawsonia intracellularis]